MFINRKNELEMLSEEYRYVDNSFVVIYGRRRTGKTTLINKFLEDKPSLYFFADTQNELSQMKRFQMQVSETFNDDLLDDVEIKSWDSLFRMLITKINPDEKFVIAIDEFQNLHKSNKDFPAIFQRLYDTILKNHNIMIILCGSLISMMYNQTLAYDSPLYGRRTAQIKLQPIEFPYYSEFYSINHEKLIEYYSVTGGIPKYIEQFHSGRTFLNTIEKEVLNKNKFLYYEPRFLLREEVSDVSSYFSILTAISLGNHKMSTISSKLGVNASKLTAYIKKLIDLDILERQVPITEANPEKSKSGLYFIKDNFLRFWFRFVFPYQSYLERGNTEFVVEKIRKDLVYHISGVFEDICREFIYRVDMPNIWLKSGRWWNKNEEIDVVAIGSENEMLFGECKWTNRKTGMKVLHDLQNKSMLVNMQNSKRKIYCLFSKSGFTRELEDYSANNTTLYLFTPEDLT